MMGVLVGRGGPEPPTSAFYARLAICCWIWRYALKPGG